MADDDLDMLQQLLEMADDDDTASVASDSQTQVNLGTSNARQEKPEHTENLPPNKRAKVIQVKPLVEGKPSISGRPLCLLEFDLCGPCSFPAGKQACD